MAVGEVWHHHIHVPASGIPDAVEVDLSPGWYLVIASANFVQQQTAAEPDPEGILAPDSSGTITLTLDDATKPLDFSTAQLGAVEYTEQPIYEYPHDIHKPDHIVVGETLHGLKAGVAVINALVYVADDAAGELTLTTYLWNVSLIRGAISVLEVSVPPQRQAHLGAHVTPA